MAELTTITTIADRAVDIEAVIMKYQEDMVGSGPNPLTRDRRLHAPTQVGQGPPPQPGKKFCNGCQWTSTQNIANCLICTYCAKRGHTYEQCCTRLRDEQQKENQGMQTIAINTLALYNKVTINNMTDTFPCYNSLSLKEATPLEEDVQCCVRSQH
jgi:hypothetical protein